MLQSLLNTWCAFFYIHTEGPTPFKISCPIKNSNDEKHTSLNSLLAWSLSPTAVANSYSKNLEWSNSPHYLYILRVQDLSI